MSNKDTLSLSCPPINADRVTWEKWEEWKEWATDDHDLMVKTTEACVERSRAKLEDVISEPNKREFLDSLLSSAIRTNNYLAVIKECHLSEMDIIAYPCQTILNDTVERYRQLITDKELLTQWLDQEKDELYPGTTRDTELFSDHRGKVN
ncbi:hypothetical protein I203_103110 [Kwoniella mangroviensis CBS 8507]|uniref:uncharacterized protein n=1 Tax=Kwoniella mangroviensis CBS 8507 TaxID=1296122 RepID=UPI00080D122C|nr:uncharacterized protein I203_07517 [Kwoniella mangroviensis CBS 8507]OCF63448.1 hypothetical protein I203_07517 [Kwoniella mangroviensis CBS 8507]